MSDNNDPNLFESIKEAATAAGQAELDRQLDYMKEGVDAVRRKLEREQSNLPRQYCKEEPSGIILPHGNKETCEQDGGVWHDRRKAYEKVKDKFESAREFMPNYLDRAAEKMRSNANNILENSNPRNKTANKTEYIDVSYGLFREACRDKDDTIVIEDYDGNRNPLRLEKRLWGGKKFNPDKIDVVEYTEDANMYLGPTKVSIQRAITSDMPSPKDPKDQVAAFTMAIKKLTWENKDPNRPTFGDLTVEFYTMPGANSVFPSDDFSAFIPLALSDDRFDAQTIQFGRYVNTGAASVDFMSSFQNAWRYDTVNRLGADANNMLGKIIDVANEEILSREFFCCIFFEIMAANPDLKEVIGEDPGLDPSDLGKLKIKSLEKKIEKIKKDESWADDPEKVKKVQAHEEKITYYEQHGYSVQDFLNEQKGWLLQLKNIIEIIVGLFQNQQFQFGWPALSINILEILINSVYAVLMIVLEEIQQHVLKECYDWVAEKKAEADAKVKETLEHEGYCVGEEDNYFNRTDCQKAGFIWEPGATWETAAINCLPWEQILIVVIDTLFGDDGLFKHIKGFIDRIKADMLLKTKNLNSESYELDETLDNSKFLKYLLQALDILDWLLALNADGLQLCNMYSRNLDALGPDHYKQTVEDNLSGNVNTGGQTIITGSEDPMVGNEDVLTGNVPGGGGTMSSSGRMPSDYHSSSKIDITGNIVNPLGLLLYQTDDDVKKFFTQYMGLTPEEAAEAVTGEKRGQCMKKLSKDEAQQLKQILNNTKMEI